MTQYESPFLELITFEMTQIITTSSGDSTLKDIVTEEGGGSEWDEFQ